MASNGTAEVTVRLDLQNVSEVQALIAAAQEVTLYYFRGEFEVPVAFGNLIGKLDDALGNLESNYDGE